MPSWNKLSFEQRICPQCGKKFLAKRFKRHFKKFCTSECYADFRRGKKRDPEIVARATLEMKNALKKPETRAKMSKARLARKHSEKTREKISKTKAEQWAVGKGIRPHQSFYTSSKTGNEELSDSSYEVRRFKALDASPSVKSWTKKHGIKIPYMLRGKRHRYIPDILIKYHDGRTVLEEVKGFVFDKRAFAAKNIAALLTTSLFENTTFRVIFGDMLDVVE